MKRNSVSNSPVEPHYATHTCVQTGGIDHVDFLLNFLNRKRTVRTGGGKGSGSEIRAEELNKVIKMTRDCAPSNIRYVYH